MVAVILEGLEWELEFLFDHSRYNYKTYRACNQSQSSGGWNWNCNCGWNWRDSTSARRGLVETRLDRSETPSSKYNVVTIITEAYD